MAKNSKSVSQIMQILESRAPSGTAEEWDNVGLLVGSPHWETPGAVVSIDLTEESIRTAKAKGYRLIINHHPCIFPKSRGLSRITPPSLVFEALQNGIAVAATHTNFDQCALEVIQSISEGLGVTPMGRLMDQPDGSLIKLVVFVPKDHLEKVRTAICGAGAGHIGAYDQCTFSTLGQGSFQGGQGTDPFLGKPGKLERADEYRLETVLPKGLQKPVLQALFEAHPYEEVAFDLYPIEQGPRAGGLVRGLGYGFWGDFPKAMSFPDLAQHVKRLFQVDGYLLTEPSPKKVKRIGFVAGKGASFIGAAAAAGCDLFITGEAGYHDALSGSRRGMAVMELGHRESERFFLTTIKTWLSQEGLKSVELNLPTQKIIT